MKKTVFRICTGNTCRNRSQELHQATVRKIDSMGLHESVTVDTCLCLGQCERGPNIKIEQGAESSIMLGTTPHKIGMEMERIAGKRIAIVPGKAKRAMSDILRGGF